MASVGGWAPEAIIELAIQAVLVFVTLLGILAAIEKDWVRRHLLAPKFEFRWKSGPPCLEITTKTDEIDPKLRSYGLQDDVFKVHNYRLQLRNVSSAFAAEGVEVYVRRLCEVFPNKDPDERDELPPLRLRFSYSGETRLQSLPAGAVVYLDLGEVFEQQPAEIDRWLNATRALRLKVEHDLHSRAHWVQNGSYAIVLEVHSSNSRPTQHTIYFEVTGGWSERFPDDYTAEVSVQSPPYDGAEAAK